MIGKIYYGFLDKWDDSYEGLIIQENLIKIMYIKYSNMVYENRLRICDYDKTNELKELDKSPKDYFDLLFSGKIDYDDWYDLKGDI